MRILLRSDAGVQTGTGHVMRCLTLAEELLGRGHEVVLLGSIGDVAWLREQVADSGVEVQDVERHPRRCQPFAPGLRSRRRRLVPDRPAPIAALDSRIPVLA